LHPTSGYFLGVRVCEFVCAPPCVYEWASVASSPDTQVCSRRIEHCARRYSCSEVLETE